MQMLYMSTKKKLKKNFMVLLEIAVRLRARRKVKVYFNSSSFRNLFLIRKQEAKQCYIFNL